MGGDGTERAAVVRRDEGPREGTSLERLAKLKPAFKPDGSVTAGSSSQASGSSSSSSSSSRRRRRSSSSSSSRSSRSSSSSSSRAVL